MIPDQFWTAVILGLAAVVLVMCILAVACDLGVRFVTRHDTPAPTLLPEPLEVDDMDWLTDAECALLEAAIQHVIDADFAAWETQMRTNRSTP